MDESARNSKRKEILMSELVSDNQGRETARMARNVGVPRQRYQVALTDGTMQQVLCALRDALPITVGIPLEDRKSVV